MVLETVGLKKISIKQWTMSLQITECYVLIYHKQKKSVAFWWGWQMTHPGHGIHQRSVSQQTANHFHLTCPSCHVESCLTPLMCKHTALRIWATREMCAHFQKTGPLMWTNYDSQCCEHQERLHSAAAKEQCWGDPWKLLRGWESNQTRRRNIEKTNELRLVKEHAMSSESDKSLTSVIAWMEAPYLISSSITFTLFFLQAMWRGVNPFW